MLCEAEFCASSFTFCRFGDRVHSSNCLFFGCSELCAVELCPVLCDVKLCRAFCASSFTFVVLAIEYCTLQYVFSLAAHQIVIEGTCC